MSAIEPVTTREEGQRHGTREYKPWVCLGILGIAGVLLVLFSTSLFGSGLNPDSVHYISAARSLIVGKGFVDVSGSPYVTWPPLFPALLALVGFGGIDPAEGMRVLNAVFFGCVIFLSGLWLLRNFKSLPVALIGSMAIFLSVPLLLDSQYVLTEIFFILLVLLSIFAIEMFLNSDKKRWLFLSAVFAALACITRYAGVTIILTGLVLLLFWQNTNLKNRLKNGAIFTLVSALPLVAWMVRNYVVSSTLMGAHSPSSLTLVESAYAVFASISQFFLPSQVPVILRILIILLLFILAISALVIVMRRTRNNTSIIGTKAMLPLFVFVIIYLIFLIITSTINHYDIGGYRLESPAYVPLVLLAAAILNYIPVLWRDHPWQKALNILLIGIICIWLIYPVLGTANVVRTSVRDGIDGYSTQKWKKSDLINYLTEHPLSGKVFSNDPYAIYILIGMRTKMSPNYYTSAENATNDLLKFRDTVNISEPTYIVWFDNSSIWRVYTIQQISSMFDMEVTIRRSDGTIYLVKAK